MYHTTKLIRSMNHPYSWPMLCVAGWVLAGGFHSGLASAQTAYEIDCQPGNVCREKSTLLPLRALPRPYSSLYKSKEAKKDNELTANVKAFSPVYVFAREDVDYSNPAEPKGWYQVGATLKAPLGWMQAKDIIEWRQALVVSYTHPGTGGEDDRKRVLMFNSKEALEAVVGAADRPEQANKLYAQIKDGKKPDSVISIEPKEFLNIENTFYILPVVGYKVESRFDDETRLLQLAAGVPGKRSTPGHETTLGDKGFMAEASGSEIVQLEGEIAKNLTVDVIFVMDMTNSMGPYIELTKKAITDLAKTVTADPKVSKAVKFGFVGYRDSIKVMPGLEFTANNFTPTLLEDTQFVELVDQQVKAATVGSNDYAEEVYAGVTEALNSTKWGGGLRFLVLVGDASAHEPGHPQSTTGLDAPRVRSLADEANAYILAIHLRDGKASADWPIAEQQLGTIAFNQGTEKPALYNVDVANPDTFKGLVEGITNKIASAIADAQKGGAVNPGAIKKGSSVSGAGASTSDPTGAGGRGAASPPTASSGGGEIVPGLGDVIGAALVDYLGSKEGVPPRDLTAWAMDRDLIDPRKKSLDVRVLINREDLNNLIIAVGSVIDALAHADLSQMQFFQALQSVVTMQTKNQSVSFEKAKKLADAKLTGEEKLLPKWLEGLPYKSAIQELSDEKFEAMTPTERSELDKSLRAKLQFYRDISEKVDAWQLLSDQDPDSNISKVYPLKLDDLP